MWTEGQIKHTFRPPYNKQKLEASWKVKNQSKTFLCALENGR